MRSVFALHIKILTLGFCVLSWPRAMAEDVSSTKVQGPWIDSRAYLNTATPEGATFNIPILENLNQALIKGLRNTEHQQSVMRLQKETGTQPQDFGEGWLLKNNAIRAADANSTHATRWSLFRNAKTYSGKEIKIDVVPESIKKGFRFDQSAPKEGEVATTLTGTPVTYGLILKSIEPSDSELHVAALSTDVDAEAAYFKNAPKADLQYDIGPIPVTSSQTYNFLSTPEPAKKGFYWRDYMPDHRFRGKFSPRSMPTAAKPVPDQTLTLEQVQGYYSAEIQFVDGLHQENLVHRFSIPVYRNLKLYEEYGEGFRPIKVLIAQDYNNGFYSNLEHYFVDRRYRAGLFYRSGFKNLEIYVNLPDASLNPSWKKHQSWELSLLTAL
jgi:hypothetical protein